MEDLKIFVSIVVAAILFVGGSLFISNYLNEKQCANNVTEMGRNYRYDLINGCRIQQKDGTYIYWEMYRTMNQ